MSRESRESSEQLSVVAMEIQNRVAPIIVLAYLFIALTVFLAAPILFVSAARTPFIGAFVEHTLMINTSQPTQPGGWGEELQINGKRLGFGYQIIAIDGQAVSSVNDLRTTLSQHVIGDVIALTTRTPTGGEQVFNIKLMSLPIPDRISYFVIPYITGLVYLLSGLYVFGIRRFDPAGRAFVLFAASAAIGLASLFDLYTTSDLAPAWTFSLAISAGALVNLALLFPEPVRRVVKYPFLGWVGYGVAVILGLAGLLTLSNFDHPTAYVTAWRFIFIYMALGLAFFMAMTGFRRWRALSPIVREQARLIFWGALLAFAPLGLWLIITVFYPPLLFTSYLLLPLGIFPLFAAYAIVRYRLLRTDYVLSQAVLYAGLAGIAMAGYALLVGGLSMVVGGVLRPADPLMIGLLVFLLAIGLNPVRLYLQRVIDRFFFRGQIVYREKSQAFARELTQVMELDEIVSVLRRYCEEALQPSYLHIYVFDPFSGYYVATAGEERGAPSSDVRFALNSPLVQMLSKQREALFISDMANLPAQLQPEQARLNLLWAVLFVPLPGRKQLIGWIALGTRRSGDPYTSRDLNFLAVLSDQAALAVERAQVVADLERRVREMNVLTRVAQGVSYTVAFDDILELIATQTNQVMPARDLRFTLYDKETDVIYYAFCLENDERIPEMENRPMAPTRGLEGEVIRTQRAIITDDYERETRGRGLLSNQQGVYAWIGVPLNAGAETIGAISVASRDPAVVYTDEQLGLLQAIADQASGAIVKARSLEESERRARQLAKLNEIGLGLTSTLDIKPLLNQILESAVEILSCQAGSLFLVDPQTDELVFEVVLGPVAANLTGRRLPPGTGMVGQSVQTGRPIIANDAKRRKEWFEKTDEQTGFDTQDLLVVPMRMQDRVIGVIEVINKVSGSPFVRADQELLTAFTSQATIAIENARLYTMTDQALAARVEELSVMQRIDRELNASLEIERSMRLTLDWAMRQSRAEAGLVGTVEKDGIHVMTFQGYTSELERYRPDGDGAHYRLPSDMPMLYEVVEKGQPRCILESEVLAETGLRVRGAVSSGAVSSGAAPGADTTSGIVYSDVQTFGLLPGAKQQIIIPIRRETTTIGVMLLENRRNEACPEDILSFLSRLSDHAAIAIANAQLYEEVKEANLAKSRFVSFVAHELKNPMASIKGYTELVSGGMAGPINEMQNSFLATVRSNVDRMNTIVSDLNDLTKIQVGNMRLDYKAVQVNEVLEEVTRSLKRQVEDKKQVLEVKLPADLPTVWADPARVAQILTNLVSNAHKYTDEGGAIFIGAEQQAAEEGDLAGAEFVHLWVKDSGIGISEEDQRQVFQQYFRTDTAKEMASGTGLGLSITKSLVEMQGGRIWFDSAVGQGTTFHVTFPVAETEVQS
jgi:signal transduction histidine kinase/putative methionine-R-sulfoxide reductase with GAF domain